MYFSEYMLSRKLRCFINSFCFVFLLNTVSKLILKNESFLIDNGQNGSWRILLRRFIQASYSILSRSDQFGWSANFIIIEEIIGAFLDRSKEKLGQFFYKWALIKMICEHMFSSWEQLILFVIKRNFSWNKRFFLIKQPNRFRDEIQLESTNANMFMFDFTTVATSEAFQLTMSLASVVTLRTFVARDNTNISGFNFTSQTV